MGSPLPTVRVVAVTGVASLELAWRAADSGALMSGWLLASGCGSDHLIGLALRALLAHGLLEETPGG